jgi:hypothetical protein
MTATTESSRTTDAQRINQPRGPREAGDQMDGSGILRWVVEDEMQTGGVEWNKY